MVYELRDEGLTLVPGMEVLSLMVAALINTELRTRLIFPTKVKTSSNATRTFDSESSDIY